MIIINKLDFIANSTPVPVANSRKKYGAHPLLVKIQALVHSICLLIVDNNRRIVNRKVLIKLMGYIHALNLKELLCANRILFTQREPHIRGRTRILEKIRDLRQLITLYKAEISKLPSTLLQ